MANVKIRYLIQRKGGAYLYKRRIPKDLRHRSDIYGKREFIERYLGTSDETVAAARVAKINREVEAEFAALRRDEKVTADQVRWIRLAAQSAEYDSLKDDPLAASEHDIADIDFSEIHTKARDYLYRAGLPPTPANVDEAARAVFLGTIGAIELWKGGHAPADVPSAPAVTPATIAGDTAAHLDEFLRSQPHVSEKTTAQHKQNITRLSERFPTLGEISWRALQGWIGELREQGLKTTSIRKITSNCSVYFTFLMRAGIAPEGPSPFDNLNLKTLGGEVTKRRPWEPEEIENLISAANVDMANIIRIAMYSGTRLGEIMNLTAGDVTEKSFCITKAKTPSGIREVPIHKNVRTVFKKLTAGKSPDEKLFPKTSNNYSNQFKYLREKLGYNSEATVFHSFRNTVITRLERAGVDERIVQDIVGQKRSTLTGDVYSGKSELETKAAALAKLRYDRA